MSDEEKIESALANTFEMYRNRVSTLRPRPTLLNMPNLLDEEWRPFKEAIAATNAYKRVEGRWIWARGRQNAISVDWISEWTSSQFHFDEPAGPIAARIVDALTTERATLRHCTALWGIRLANPIDIDDRLSALPVADFENRYQSSFNDRPNSANFLGSNRSAVIGPPTAVVVATFQQFPFISTMPSRQNGIANFLAVGAERISVSFVAAGSLKPIIDISWYEYENDNLNRVFLEGRRFWRTPEIVPTNIQPIDIDANRIMQFIGRMGELSSQRRGKLLSAMRRFEQSLSRHSAGNQAIDLCTALEQLLGSDGQSPISWSNGLRCAALVGRDDDEKCKVRDVINSLYKARNQFVHGGELDTNITTRTMGQVPLSIILSNTQLLFGRLVERLVELERDPDWFRLETCGHA